jgi:WD40 repeat protein
MNLPNRLYLASVDQQNGIYIADLHSKESQLFFPLPEQCWNLQISRDQKSVFAGSMTSGNIFIVNVFNGGEPITIRTTGTQVTRTLLHPNQKSLYAATDNGVFCVDLETLDAQLLFGKGSHFTALDIDPDSTTLFGLSGLQVFSYSLADGKEPQLSATITASQLTGANYAVPYDVKFDDANKLLWVCYCGSQASGEATNQILMFKSGSLEYVKSINVGSNPCRLALSSTSNLLGVLCMDSNLWLIDTSSQTPSSKINPNPAAFDQYGFSLWCLAEQKGHFYIPCYFTGSYLIFDATSQSFSGPFPVPYQAEGFPGNKLNWVVAGSYPQPLIAEAPAGCTTGQEITITGAGFCNWVQSLKVIFSGDVAVTPTSATLTSLSVLVPTKAVSGPVTIAINGLTSAPSNPITIIPPGSAPSVASFFPINVIPGMWLSIKGKNFIAGGRVNFAGGVSAVFDEKSTVTEAYVKVPAGAQSGTLCVTCQGISSLPSATSLQVATTPVIIAVPISGR